jgi:glutaredoxin-related protein
MERFHPDAIAEVSAAIREHPVVVVGMGWNPHVKRARKALEAAGVEHHYLEYGNYSSQWRLRLAIKLWAGWPTFPQVFVNGELLGGADETEAALAEGALTPSPA